MIAPLVACCETLRRQCDARVVRLSELGGAVVTQAGAEPLDAQPESLTVPVGERHRLEVLFDRRSSLGVVRLRVRQALPRLVALLSETGVPGQSGPKFQN